jgi:hypothetical protein
MLEKLSKEFLQLEFAKNHRVNYIVRCSDAGDGEESQILDDEYQDWKIINESIPKEVRKKANKRLKLIFEAANLDSDEDDEDEDIEDNLSEDLEYVADLLRPYITWSELYKLDFNNWECLVTASYDCLEEKEDK